LPGLLATARGQFRGNRGNAVENADLDRIGGQELAGELPQRRQFAGVYGVDGLQGAASLQRHTRGFSADWLEPGGSLRQGPVIIKEIRLP
jgi:hypothetical protein